MLYLALLENMARKLKKYLLIPLIFTLFTDKDLYSDWYNSAWNYRKRISIDQAVISGTLTNFPWLIKMSADTGLSAHAQADGDAILFTLADGTNKLAHELESYSGGSLLVA